MFKISVVIPAFNEQSNIEEVTLRVEEVLKSLSSQYEIIFVNDGSKDKTLNVLKRLNTANKNIHYLSFSRNFGHQFALKAGIDYASGDCVLSMDADLQHPPRLIPLMVQKWQEGYDIVYTKRAEQQSLSYFKRKTSSVFYNIMNILSDIEIEEGTADFRLLDRKVVNIIKQNQDHSLFLRGYITWIGFKQYKIDYTPEERFSGQSKYTLKKMLTLALNGITSFSVKPLHLSTLIGASISFLSFLYALYAILIFLFTDEAISGWTSVLVSVLFIGGIQLLILGIIGEYLGKIFIQIKGRPNYIVEEHDEGINNII